MVRTGVRLTPSVVARYAIGSLGTGGFSTLPGLVLVYYLTDTLGVVPLLAGLVVTLAKIWDVIIDPVIGGRSDAALASTGTRRRAMIIGSGALPVLFALTFAVPAPFGEAAATVWVLIAFLGAATAFSLFQVPYLGLPAELTDSYHERTRLVSVRVVVLTVAILLFGAGGPLLRGTSANEHTGYLIMGVGAGLVLALGLLVSCTVVPAGAASPVVRQKASLRAHYAAGWAGLRRSRPFRLLLGAFLLQALATGTMLAAAQYVATWVLHRESLIDALFAVLVAPAVLAAPGWAVVSRRIGKERAFLIASGLFGVAALAITGLIIAPGLWVLAAVAVAGVAYAGLQTLPIAMLPDVISDDATRHGPGQAGAFSGLWTAGETAGMALGTTVLSIVLAATGYLATKGTASVTQPASAVTGIAATFSVVPVLLIAASMIVFVRYPLRAADIDPTEPADEGTTR